MALRIEPVEERAAVNSSGPLLYRKAVISKDGLCIQFRYKGQEWTASPSELKPGKWFVARSGQAIHGFGVSIWDALEESKEYACQLWLSEALGHPARDALRTEPR